MVTLMLIGAAMIPMLNIQYSPSIRQKGISVYFGWNGASARVVEQEVTSKIEGTLASLSGIQEMYSSSYKDGGSVSLAFKQEANMDAIRFEISSRLRQLYPSLPEGVSYPSLSTGMDGESASPVLTYTINADKGDILVFSYVGAKTVEKKVEGNVLDVVLAADVRDIDEVVVTAIGIKQEKKKLGYTTQQVDGAEIAAAGNLNPGASLQGEVAGLTVSIPSGMFQSPTFSLRGKTPLIVLDGVPIESDLFDLSSENIASVNVLKGTAASALYGARGRNGAIMITTKQADKEGVEIKFSTKNMVQAGYPAFPETQHEYGSGSKGEYAFWDGEGGGIRYATR